MAKDAALIKTTQETFSINCFSPDERLKKWREYLAEVYCRQDVRVLSTDGASGAISKRAIGDINISRFRAGVAQQVVRTNSQAKLDGVETFHFVFPVTGRFAYAQGDRHECACAGEAFIINASHEFKIDFSADAESMVIAVPCEAMRQRIVGIDDFIASATLSDALFTRILSNIASSILCTDSNADVSILQEVCVSAIAFAVAAARGQYRRQRGVSEAIGQSLDKLRAIIELKCSDTSFDLLGLAFASGISRRQIQKAFSLFGTTFSLELLNARLSKASRLVRSGRSIQIGVIAQQCGFISQSHFSRCYRKRFGVAPRDHKITA